MARLRFARAMLPETAAKWVPAWKRGSSPNVSRSAKLERRHKPEVTLIDYLELICIFRVIMGVGNRPNRHSHRCGSLMMFLITLSSPQAAGKVSKGLSSQIWTINEQTWSRGDVWKWARRGPLSEAVVSRLQHNIQRKAPCDHRWFNAHAVLQVTHCYIILHKGWHCNMHVSSIYLSIYLHVLLFSLHIFISMQEKQSYFKDMDQMFYTHPPWYT